MRLHTAPSAAPAGRGGGAGLRKARLHGRGCNLPCQ